MDLDVEFRDACLQPFLHIGDGPVVNQGAEFFEEEAEQTSGSDVADLLLPVLCSWK